MYFYYSFALLCNMIIVMQFQAASSGYLLRIESSAMGANSNSKAVGDAFVEVGAHTGARVFFFPFFLFLNLVILASSLYL